MEETGKQQREKMLLQVAFDGNLRLLRKMARGLDTGQGEAAVVAAVADSGSGNRTLHLAATKGRMDVCRYLVEDLRLDVNQPNDRGGGWEEDTDLAYRVHGEEHSEAHAECQWGAPTIFGCKGG